MTTEGYQLNIDIEEVQDWLSAIRRVKQLNL